MFFTINHIFVSATAFSSRNITGEDRNEYVFQWLMNHLDTGLGRIIAAVLGRGVEHRTGHLTGPAAIALINVNLDYFYFLLFIFGGLVFSSQRSILHIFSYLIFALADFFPEEVGPFSVRIPLSTKSWLM